MSWLTTGHQASTPQPAQAGESSLPALSLPPQPEGFFAAPRPPAGILHRQRISDLIDHGVDRGVGVLLLGPSGSGKTTALADWASRCTLQARRVWVTVDEASRTRAGFWRKVSRTLAMAGLVPDRDVQDTIDHPDADFTSLPVQLALDLTRTGERVLLVIDGAERLFNMQVAKDVLALCQYSARLTVIATGRMTNPEADGYLAALGTTIIRADEFALSVEECRELLVEEIGPQAAVLAPTLRHETGGWPLPVRLVLPEIARTPASRWDALVRAASSAFFGSRLVDSLDIPGIGEFIAVTSLAETFSVELASQLTGRSADDVCNLIEALLRHGLGAWQPTTESDRGAFRYHDMLLSVADEQQRRLPKGRRREAHRLIARWAEQHGDIREAILHAARGNDPDHATALITAHLQTFFVNFDADVMAAINSIDPSLLRQDPILLFIRGIGRNAAPETAQAGASDLLRAIRIAAGELPRATGVRRLTLLGITCVVQRLTGQWGELEKTLPRLEQQLDDFARADELEVLELQLQLRLQAAMGRLRLGQNTRAREQATLVLQREQQGGPTAAAGSAIGVIAFTLAYEGDVRAAEQMTQRGFAQAKPYGWHSAYAGVHLRLAAALIALEHRDIEQMHAHLRAVEPHMPRLEHWPEATILTSWALLMTEGAAAANAYVYRQIESHAAHVPWSPTVRTRTLAIWAGTCAIGGMTQLAVEHLDGLPTDNPAVRLSRIIVDLQTGRLEQSAADASELSTDTGIPVRGRVLAAIIVAGALWLSGRRDQAERYYRAASAAALPIGMSLSHRVLPVSVGRALFASWAAHRADTVSAELSDADARLTALWNEPVGAEPLERVELTARETEVLRLISDGETTASMAQKLHVTVNTIKSQRSSLYRKLGAGNRTEALDRAMQLGLFHSIDSVRPKKGDE